MVTLTFGMLVIVIFAGLLGLEGWPGNGLLPRRSAEMWAWLTTGNWPARLGAGLIVLGVGALLHYLLIHVNVPDTLKLGSGGALGALLAAAALALRGQAQRRGLRLALAGAAGGVAYLTAYSAYAVSGYAPQSAGLALLALVAVMVGVIAVRERAQSLAVLAMLGGFIAPYFALSPAGPLALNGYYLLLSLLVLAMVALRGWRWLVYLGFLFTLAATLFFGGSQNYDAPQHYGVMLPMLLALTGVYLVMPMVQGRHGDAHAAWLRRVDRVYAWALPLVALALAVRLAPSGTSAALALAWLAGLWLLGAALARAMRQPVARYLWLAGGLLLLAAAVYWRSVPCPLLGVLVACALYVVAPRLGLQARHQDMLGVAILALAVLHIAEHTLCEATHALWLTYAGKFVLAGALLGVAWLGRRRASGFTPVLGWAGGLWGALALMGLLPDLRLDNWASVLFVAGLAVSGALFALPLVRPRWTVPLAVPAVLVVWLTVSGWGAAGEMALPWDALAALGLLVALGLLTRVALRHPGQERGSTVAGIVLVLLPLALLPWAQAIGQQRGWDGASFGMSVLAIGVLLSAMMARLELAREGHWQRELAPVMFYVVAAVLALHLLVGVERQAWNILFELLALTYLVLRVYWAVQDGFGDATMRRCRLTGVLLLVLFVQAQALRLWGPSDAWLTVLDWGGMTPPVLLSLLWAALGVALAIGGHRLRERLMWSMGAGLMVLAAGKIVLFDLGGSLGSLQNILAIIAAGGMFLAVSGWAPFPPACPASPSDPAADETPAAAPRPGFGISDSPVPPVPSAPSVAGRSGIPDMADDGLAAQPARCCGTFFPSLSRVSVAQAFFPRADRTRAPVRDEPPIEPSDCSLLPWVIVVGVMLLVWVGYQNFQKSQQRRTAFLLEQIAERATGDDLSADEPALATLVDKASVAAPASAVQPAVLATARPAETVKSVVVKKSSCALADAHWPDGLRVYAAGGYAGRTLPFQIDSSGHAATQFDLVVNNPSGPVALVLGAHEPTIWNIGWTPDTRIVAVLISGSYRQVVTGLPNTVPVINSSPASGGSCGRFYVTQDQNPLLNPVARRLFGKPVDMVFPGGKSGAIVVGAPIVSTTALLTAAVRSPESFRDASTPLAGQAGLDEAVAQGQLRPSTDDDANAWAAAIAARLPAPDVPPVAGLDKPQPRSPRVLTQGYVVLKPFTYPTGLYGAHSATFFVPQGVPLPKGDPGHSVVYDFNSLQCRQGPVLCLAQR